MVISNFAGFTILLFAFYICFNVLFSDRGALTVKLWNAAAFMVVVNLINTLAGNYGHLIKAYALENPEGAISWVIAALLAAIAFKIQSAFFQAAHDVMGSTVNKAIAVEVKAANKPEESSSCSSF